MFQDLHNCEEDMLHWKKFLSSDDLEMILEGIAQSTPVTYQYDSGIYVITNKKLMPMEK